MPAQSGYFATYYQNSSPPSISSSRSQNASALARSASSSARSQANSSGSSIKTSSSIVHATQSVQRVALHARRASATSQVLLATGLHSSTATPLQSSAPVPVTSRASSVAGDDSAEIGVDMLEAIEWPQPPVSIPSHGSISSSVRSPTPLSLTRVNPSPLPSYPFLQSDPTASPSGSRTLTLPPPTHFYQPSPIDAEQPDANAKWGFTSPGASTTRFSGFTNKTSLSADAWSEAAAKGSASAHTTELDGASHELRRSHSNETMTTGRAVKGRDSLSSLASRLARTLSSKSSRSRKSSKRGSGSVSVKSAAGVAWEPYTYGQDEVAKMRDWEEVRNRENRLGLSALVGRARVMEKMLKDGKRVSNPESVPFSGPGTGYIHYPAIAATRAPFGLPHRPSSLQSLWKSASTTPSSAPSAVRSNSGKSIRHTPSVKSGRSKRLSIKTIRDRENAFTPLDDGQNEDSDATLSTPDDRPGLVVHRGSDPPPLPDKHRRSAYACCSDIPEEKSPAYFEEKVFDLTPDGPHLHTRKVRIEGEGDCSRKYDSRMSLLATWARDGKRWRLALTIGAAIIVILVTGLLAGLLTRDKDDAEDASPSLVPTGGCDSGKVGVSCTIDSSCTTGNSPVSHALADLLPQLTSSFGLTISTDELSSLLVSVGVPAADGDCSEQAILIDVGATLVTAESRSSVGWAQAAILWQLVRSEDASSARRLREVINNANAAQAGVRLAGAAAVIETRAQSRLVDFEGWMFDLDAQTVEPKGVSWLAEAAPNPFQVSLAEDSLTTLDRLTSFAKASSAQRSTALSRHWLGPLAQPLASLDGFLSAIRSSPFLLPFNGSSSSEGIDLVNQLTDATMSFPPSTSCFSPDSAQISTLRAAERSAFGLNDTECSQRPIHGFINVLRTRANRNGSQALVLNEDAKTRVGVHHGWLTSGDAREWGMLGSMEHAVLSWLKAFPTTGLAREAINFISNATSPISPPPPNAALLADNIPQLDIALFGPSLISTTNFTLSLLSDPNVGLFFGSTQASRLRSWALQSTNGGPPSASLSPAIVWAQNASSPECFIEQSTSDTAFDGVFNDAARLIQATREAGRTAGMKEEEAVVKELRNKKLGSIGNL